LKVRTIHLHLAIPILLVLLWVFLFFLPVSSKEREKAETLQKIRKEMETLDREIESALSLKKRKDELDFRMREVKESIPTRESVYEFLARMVSSAKRRGLEIEAIQPLFTSFKELEGKHFLYPVFEVTLKGRFLEIGRFLEEMKATQAYRGVVRAKISYDEGTYPLLNGKVVLEIRILK